jgi:hypothetical protein
LNVSLLERKEELAEAGDLNAEFEVVAVMHTSILSWVPGRKLASQGTPFEEVGECRLSLPSTLVVSVPSGCFVVLEAMS